MRLTGSLAAWGTPDFAAALKRELAAHTDALPLQQALRGTSTVGDDPITVLLLTAQADTVSLRIKVGIFFSGILAGCSCADDPTPVESQTEYCELQLTVDRTTGQTAVEMGGTK